MPNKNLILDENLALKRKKAGKITALCFLSVVFVLVVLIVVAACIPTNLKPNFIANPDRIVVYNQNSTYGEFTSDRDKYNSFMQQFDESFTSSYLVALFSGRLGDYVIDSSSEQNGTTLSSVLSELQSGFYVEFKYSQPQTLTYANGEVYHSVFNSSRTIEFTSVYFALSSTDEFSDLNMYVSYKTSSTSSTNYVIKIAQKANTYALYENRAAFRN